MISIQDQLRKRAASLNRTLVLPECSDERIFTAAIKISKLKIGKIILLGNNNESKIETHMNQNRISGMDIEILYPKRSKMFNKLYERFLALKLSETVGIEDSRGFLLNPVNLGAFMVAEGVADGCVCGAVTPTKDVIRAAIKLIGPDPSSQVISSSFLMVSPDGRQSFTFADCGVIPNPTVDELVIIARDAAQTHEKLTQLRSKVAFLSYSTKGSAEHEMVEKMKRAADRFSEEFPEYCSDGELQFDAAVIPSVAERKAPHSPLKGKANVLIFPDLNAGNLGYKIAQRLGQYKAWGPLLQGLKKPMMDLSRGCTIEDIVNVAAICAILYEGGGNNANI